MVRKWTWLLPCFWWLWWFKTSGKMRCEIDGGGYQCIRLDDEFLLVKYPSQRSPNYQKREAL